MEAAVDRKLLRGQGQAWKDPYQQVHRGLRLSDSALTQKALNRHRH